MKKILFAMFLLVAFANTGWCANVPGSIGETSTAAVDVQVKIPKLILINNIGTGLFQTGFLQVSDITTNGKSLDTNLCVSSNLHSTEGYHVTATDNGGGESKFQLKNSDNDLLEYTVKFNDQGNTTSNTALTYGAPSANGTFHADGQGFKDDCSNANVQINFSQTALKGAKHGTYTGVLTLVVAPD